MRLIKLAIMLVMGCNFVVSQTTSKEQIIFLTPQWEGERFEDGRPKVADDILERMKNVAIEEAWGVLRNEGYHNQFEGGWEPLHDDVPVVGRALLFNICQTDQMFLTKSKRKERPMDKSGILIHGPLTCFN